MRPVDSSRRLPGGAYDYEGSEDLFLHGERDWIAVHGNHEVNILRRVRQRAFPQSFDIGRRLPRTMVAFVNRTAQGNAGSLQRTDVVAEIHQQVRVVRQLIKVGRQFSFEGDAAARVHPGLAKTDRLRPPDEGVVRGKQNQDGGNNCRFRVLVSGEVEQKIRSHCH